MIETLEIIALGYENCTIEPCSIYFKAKMDVKYNNTIIKQEIQTIAYNNYNGEWGFSNQLSTFLLTHQEGTKSPCLFNPKNERMVYFDISQDKGAVFGAVSGIVIACIGLVPLTIGVIFFMKLSVEHH